MEIITRAEAKKRGLKFYFTGCPCKHGHVAERFTDNSTCVECDKSRRNKITARYRANNLAECRDRDRNYARDNQRARNEYRSKRYASDPAFREIKLKKDAAYRAKNAEKRRATEARRRQSIKFDANLDAYLGALGQDKPW